MAHRRFWNVAFNAKERRSSQPSAGGQGGSCLLVGVASNDCSCAPSGASPDVLRGPRAEARGYYPRPLPGAGTEAMRHPGRKAINLGVWGGAPGLENARNTPTGVPYGNIFRARPGRGSTQGSARFGSTLGYIPVAASRLKILVILPALSKAPYTCGLFSEEPPIFLPSTGVGNEAVRRARIEWPPTFFARTHFCRGLLGLLLDSFGHVGASYERAAEDGAETDRLAVTAIALEGVGFDEFLDR